MNSIRHADISEVKITASFIYIFCTKIYFVEIFGLFLDNYGNLYINLHETFSFLPNFSNDWRWSISPKNCTNFWILHC